MFIILKIKNIMIENVIKNIILTYIKREVLYAIQITFKSVKMEKDRCTPYTTSMAH